MKVVKSTKQFLTIAILVSVLGLSGYVFTLSRIAAFNKEIAFVENEIASEVTKDNRLKSVKAIMKDTEEQRKMLDQYLIAEETLVPFIETIESLSSESGATVEIVSVDVRSLEKTNEQFEYVVLSLKAGGVWGEVFHLLSLVEALPYAVAIQKVNLEQRVVGDSDDWSLALTLSVAKTK